MALPRDIVSHLVDQADKRLVGQVVSAVSVETAATRDRLRFSGRPFLDPKCEVRPTLAEVEHTALHVVRQARVRVGAFGGVASLGGLVSVPPEVLATGVAGLRLAQRLAIVYGFDPETDRGEMAVLRALAAGFEVHLPEGGAMKVRVREVPALLLGQVALDSTNAGGALATAVARRSALLVGRRITRLVPVLFSGWSAIAARDRMDAIGRRMVVVLRQLADAPEIEGHIEDAVEVS